MTKLEFLSYIADIKSDQIFITDSLDNIEEEIKSNCWSIAIDEALSSQLSVEELSNFLLEVKTDRRDQLRNSKINAALIYYIWIDDQAGQLRFNFINSKHNKLPFRSELTFVASEEEILAAYLTRFHLDSETIKVFKEVITV